MDLFYKWCIRKCLKSDSRYGDFAKDMKADYSFPKKAANKNQIREYLDSNYACDEAIDVFNELWKKYTEDITNE